MCCVAACNSLLSLYTLQSQGAFVIRDALHICVIAVLTSCGLKVFPLPVPVERLSDGAGTDFPESNQNCCCRFGAMAEAI